MKKIFWIFKVVVFLNLLICLVNGEWSATFICLFNFVLFFVCDIMQKKLKYSDIFKILMYLFLIGSLLCGEVYYLYVKIWYFDIILHTLSSFILSGLFLYLCNVLGVNINKILLILCVFSFAMMIATLWEITEFSIDRLFDKDMQKDTIITEINSSLLSIDGNSIVKKSVNSMEIGDYIVPGYLDIGLYDTIYDMICAVVGSLVYIFFCKKKKLFS